MRRLLGAVLLVAALAGCGQPRSRTVDVGPARTDAVARAEQVRLSLLPALDAARGADAAHTAELERLRAENAALHARLAATAVVRSTASRGAARPSVRTGPCGGCTATLAPSALLRRIGGCESSGRPDGPLDWTEPNHSGTSASGAYQILDSTWNGRPGRPGWKQSYGGGTDAARYTRAMYAPPDTQTTVAGRALAAQGTGPWASSRGCWG